MNATYESLRESLMRVPLAARVQGRAIGVEISDEDVVTTGVEKKVKNGYEIGRTGGVRGMQM